VPSPCQFWAAICGSVPKLIPDEACRWGSRATQGSASRGTAGDESSASGAVLRRPPIRFTKPGANFARRRPVASMVRALKIAYSLASAAGPWRLIVWVLQLTARNGMDSTSGPPPTPRGSKHITVALDAPAVIPVVASLHARRIYTPRKQSDATCANQLVGGRPHLLVQWRSSRFRSILFRAAFLGMAGVFSTREISLKIGPDAGAPPNLPGRAASANDSDRGPRSGSRGLYYLWRWRSRFHPALIGVPCVWSLSMVRGGVSLCYPVRKNGRPPDYSRPKKRQPDR